MKKLFLTSLLAVFAASGAQAANVIDGNPLYMPRAGHFYSVTDLSSHTHVANTADTVTLGEEFGYGISDKLGIMISTDVSEDEEFDAYGWDEFSVAGAYRFFDDGGWKADVIGAYGVGPVWAWHRPFLDKTNTDYLWTLGVRGGFVAHNWTIAGHAYVHYMNDESFNWNEDKGFQGIHMTTLGLDGQYLIDSKWNLVAGVEYTGFLDKEWYGIPGAKVENAGSWDGYFGVNYNIDATKFVGAYINGSMNHRGGTNADEWEFDDGFGFGMKFGIDF